MRQSRTRITKDPPIAPPTLDCPRCRKSLAASERRRAVAEAASRSSAHPRGRDLPRPEWTTTILARAGAERDAHRAFFSIEALTPWAGQLRTDHRHVGCDARGTSPCREAPGPVVGFSRPAPPVCRRQQFFSTSIRSPRSVRRCSRRRPSHRLQPTDTNWSLPGDSCRRKG
jgi:hypothetical protein